jgi:hypothetical protein
MFPWTESLMIHSRARRHHFFMDVGVYRRKYYARKTLDAFSMILRDEMDLEALRGDLIGVVRETM